MRKSSWCPRLCWAPLFLPLLLLVLAGGAVAPPAAAQISGYAVTGSPGTVAPGASLSVSWTAPSGRPSTDWVGLYRVNDPNESYIWADYTGGSASGSRSLTAPSQTGQYEFRYFLQDSYNLAARSNTVTVGGGGGGGTYTLTGSPSTVSAGGSLSVSWTAPSGRPGTDWVGLYRVGDPDGSYLWADYTGGTASGSRSLTAPSAAGQYEFRYFLQDGYTLAVKSNTITVGSSGGTYTLSGSPGTVSAGASLSVSWTAPSGRPGTDWLGLYQVGDPDGSYIWADYTGGAASGSRSLTAPSQTGQYEFRYFLQDSYTLAVRSNPVTVEGGGSTDPRASVGEWAAPFGWPAVAVHSALLPTGRVMFWSKQNGLVWSWDPQSGAIASLPGPGFNLWCSGHAFLPDGRLLVSGGNDDAIPIEGGLIGGGVRNASVYNPFTNSWQALPAMNAGRWYPSNLTLANGELLTLAGSYDGDYKHNALPQVWTGGGWRDLSGAQQMLPLYPYLHLAPGGRVFMSGPNQATQYLSTAGAGAWSFVADRQFPNRDYGASVMYDSGRVLTVGGGLPPTETAEVIDLNAGSPAWRYVGSMSVPRRQHDATLLADGQVLVTGGVTDGERFGWPDPGSPPASVLHAELWDPATERFTSVASMAVGRWYHASTLLLPDGRVLTAGGDNTVLPDGQETASNQNAQIYSPPYLFRGARPTISSAPGSAGYGSTFFVGTPEASGIGRVTLIRMASVTHTRNMDQRIVRPGFSQASGGLNVTVPSDRSLCPPGHYLLFLLNGSGVPSVARIIRIN